MQSLEERGLVVKTAVMARPDPHSPQQHFTNLLHLKRFAPAIRLGPGQYFKV